MIDPGCDRALVTGGAGFVGGAVARELLDNGTTVTIASRRAPDVPHDGRARAISVDLTDASAVREAVRGHDAIFHVAARTGVWGPREDYLRANVVATRHVVDAALDEGVRKLVFTSSPSVCFDGKDHLNAGNDLPYPSRWLCAYPETKALAEQEVLAANGRTGAAGVPLATCALRPHLVVGPGDPHLFPRLLERARAGKLAIVGRGDNQVGVTDVDNAARAHVCAAAALEPGAACAGRAYFVTQTESVELWPWLNRILEELGVPPVTRRVPLAVAYAGGAACEAVWRATGRAGEPPMTRFVALQLARSHTYDPEPARRDLGYEERFDLAAATARVVESLRSR